MHTMTGLALPVQDVSDPKGYALAAFEASYRFQNADWYCFLLLAISLIRHGQIERARRISKGKPEASAVTDPEVHLPEHGLFRPGINSG